MTIMEMENIGRSERIARVIVAIAMSIATSVFTLEPITLALINMIAVALFITGITSIDPLTLVLKTIINSLHFPGSKRQSHAH